jgi:hypothetical protein
VPLPVGAVQAIAGEMVTVRSRRLVFDGARLGLGPDRLERVRREPGGLGPGADLRPGDMVAMHWDWMCDRLPPRALVAVLHPAQPGRRERGWHPGRTGGQEPGSGSSL